MSRDDDLLERATRALRATPPPNEGELAQAKMRMLAAHQAAKKGGGRTLRWVLPLAAVLAAGSALAAVPNGMDKLAEVVNRVVGYEILAREVKLAEPHKTTKPSTKLAPPAEPAPVPAAEPAVAEPVVAEPVVAEPTMPEPAIAPVIAPAVAPEQPLATAARQPAKPRKRELAPAPTVTPEPVPAAAPAVEEPAVEEPKPTPIASADLAKYRAAHKAHFQDRDFALALRNWEAYLRQYPNGTFAIEARYNRAICLLRLGRNDEARRALTPFSKGEIGSGYRQAEATKLLEALE